MRLVDASRVFGQEIARERVRPRARPAADLLVFADAALAFPLRGIAQGAEEVRIAVDVRKLVLQHVAAADRQETARKDLARVGYEHEAFAVAHPGRPPGHPASVFVLRNAVLGLDALRHVPA